MLKNSKRFSSLTYQKEKLPTTKQLSMALDGNRMKLINSERLGCTSEIKATVDGRSHKLSEVNILLMG